MRYLAKEDLIEIEDDDDDDSQIEHGSSEISKITKESKTMSVAGKRKAESLSDS